MFPIKSEAVPYRLSFVTYGFIIACVIVVPLQKAITVRFGAFVPLDFAHSLIHPSPATLNMLLSLFLSFFMHGGLVHLLSNMWYLLVFGNAVEYVAGHRQFFLIYIACGVLSMLIQAVSNPLSGIPIVGASGAIAGIMGMYLVLLPFSRLNIWFPPFFIFRLPAFIFLLAWFWIQYVSLKNSHLGTNQLVAGWAHIGGFICGMLFALRFGGKRKKRGRR
jgi:membrane associated rhomboid family serine protease